jgi:hypothetical protein
MSEPTAPWRFVGICGDVEVHPLARLLAVSGNEFVNRDVDPPRVICKEGSTLKFEMPGLDGESSVFDLDVREPPSQVLEQLRQRGGWR